MFLMVTDLIMVWRTPHTQRIEGRLGEKSPWCDGRYQTVSGPFIAVNFILLELRYKYTIQHATEPNE